MDTLTLALRVPAEIKAQIEELAKVCHRKKSDILLGWIREKLDLERWQIAETEKAIEEADAGKFASKEEVARFYKKWSV
jgi:RHH-type rel operon transcriptional repressor/antitoxin RelB